MNTKELKETDGGLIFAYLRSKSIGEAIGDYWVGKYEQGKACN